MASDSIAAFLAKRYPSSAPFNSEALLASGLRGLDLVKRAELSAEPTHDPIAAPGFYPPSGTGTLLPSGAASTPGTRRGSVDSGLGSDAASCRSERSEGSVWSGDSGLATFSPQFTLLSRFPTTPKADFIQCARPLAWRKHRRRRTKKVFVGRKIKR